MKKIISIAICALMIGSVYAAKNEKKINLENNLKEMIERELIGNTIVIDEDIVAVDTEKNVNDQKRNLTSNL